MARGFLDTCQAVGDMRKCLLFMAERRICGNLKTCGLFYSVIKKVIKNRKNIDQIMDCM